MFVIKQAEGGAYFVLKENGGLATTEMQTEATKMTFTEAWLVLNALGDRGASGGIMEEVQMTAS